MEPQRLVGIIILVVEDDADSREMLVVLLELQGARVTPAASVSDALALFGEVQPDVVLSDIDMPGLSGHALVRQIRALPADRGANTPVIAVTGSTLTKAGAADSGFAALVPKPIHATKLCDLVQKFCSQHAAQT